MMYENDIIQDAYYLINKFNESGRSVTNMQIQKLMYFFEAYYMNLNDNVECLYQCNFNAWAFGPVAIPLYTKFRKFGNNPIELTKENIEEGNKIDAEKKKLLDNIFLTFKDFKAIDLVKITHMSNSPWERVWNKNGKKVGYGANTYIDKNETKKWFGELFGKKTMILY